MTSLATAPKPALANASRDELFDKARQLAELGWSRRAEIERDRRLPDDLVGALLDSGLPSLMNQKRFGGLESDPMVVLELGREIARGSGSLGWLFSLTSFHTWYMAFTHEQLQQDVWGSDHDVLIADSYAPVGKIDRVADGYLASGEWKFTSGIEWAGWVGVGGMAVPPDGDQPDLLMFFLPRSEISVRDEWHTLGLKGTASRTAVADQVFVPEHRVFALGKLTGPEGREVMAEQGPIWRMPLMTAQGLAVMTAVTGISQRIIEEFTETTRKRVRWLEPGGSATRGPRRSAGTRDIGHPVGRHLGARPEVRAERLGPGRRRAVLGAVRRGARAVFLLAGLHRPVLHRAERPAVHQLRSLGANGLEPAAAAVPRRALRRRPRRPGPGRRLHQSRPGVDGSAGPPVPLTPFRPRSSALPGRRPFVTDTTHRAGTPVGHERVRNRVRALSPVTRDRAEQTIGPAWRESSCPGSLAAPGSGDGPGSMPSFTTLTTSATAAWDVVTCRPNRTRHRRPVRSPINVPRAPQPRGS